MVHDFGTNHDRSYHKLLTFAKCWLVPPFPSSHGAVPSLPHGDTVRERWDSSSEKPSEWKLYCYILTTLVLVKAICNLQKSGLELCNESTTHCWQVSY